jgi:pimeloyl-ACP methyl ester carboxylesterase
MISLSSYVDSVCRIIDAQREPVVLVGHSMGGGIITQAAEYRPERIKTLVYIVALLPKNGEAIFDLAQQDTETLVSSNMEVLDDQSCAIVREAGLRELFYADCSDEDVALAKCSLVPQPMAPGRSPVTTTEASFGRIPRVYIECRRGAVTPPFQRKLYTSLPCQKYIVTMPKGDLDGHQSFAVSFSCSGVGCSFNLNMKASCGVERGHS